MKLQLITKEWRLLKELLYLDPNWNLAIEDAVRLTVEKQSVSNTLRFWKNWNTVVIGRFQCPKLEIEFTSCLKNKTNLSRRFTGGGTVYHDDGNLNFAISKFKHLNENSPFFASTFIKKVGLTVAKALRTLGIQAELVKRNIFVADRKISGLAGMVTKKSIFVHGSMLIKSNLEILSQVLNSKKESVNNRFVRSDPKKVTNIKNELYREIEMKEVKKILVDAFEEEFEIIFIDGKLKKEEIILAETLYKEKYSSPMWLLSTCEGCPKFKMDAPVISILSSCKS
ncbi:MAG: lipoate--protein ligase family protein [Candidatus Hodarchaeales archaeon]|jgi:lipoate-protein ligase A